MKFIIHQIIWKEWIEGKYLITIFAKSGEEIISKLIAVLMTNGKPGLKNKYCAIVAPIWDKFCYFDPSATYVWIK